MKVGKACRLAEESWERETGGQGAGGEAGLWGSQKGTLHEAEKMLARWKGAALVAPGVAARLKGMLQDWGQMCIQLCPQRRVPCSCTPVPPFAKLK